MFQKLLLSGQADAAVAEANPGTAGTPWNSCAACQLVFSDEEQVAVRFLEFSVNIPQQLIGSPKQQLTRLLRTVTQRATHFPREAVRAVFAEDLRSRVYLKRPSR